MDGQDDVALVVLARQLHGHLDRGDLGLQLRDELLDVGVDVLALALQLEQYI